MIRECKHCGTELIKSTGRNGYVYTCYNCNRRYQPVENKLLELNGDRFESAYPEEEIITTKIYDCLTDGRYVERLYSNHIVDILNQQDKEILELKSRWFELKKYLTSHIQDEKQAIVDLGEDDNYYHLGKLDMLNELQEKVKYDNL